MIVGASLDKCDNCRCRKRLIRSNIGETDLCPKCWLELRNEISEELDMCIVELLDSEAE